MRFLAYLLTLFMVGTAVAQNPTILQGNYITNVFGNSNFVLNPNAQTNTANVAVSSATVARSSTTPLVATSEFNITTSTSTGYADWSTRTFDAGMKGQNCEARFTYRGFSVGSTTAQILQGANVIAQLTLTASTDPRIASINFPCGDLSSATTFRLQQATASLTGTNEIGGIYVGLATNMANVAQAEVVVRATRTTAQSIPSATTTVVAYNSASLDVLGEFNTSTGIYTAKRAGRYLVTAFIMYDTQSWAAGNIANIAIQKNSSVILETYNTLMLTGTYYTTAQINHTVELNAGDTIAISTYQNAGAARNLIANSTYNNVSIARFPSSSELVVKPETQNVWAGVVYTASNQGLFSGTAEPTSFSPFTNATWNQPTLLKGKAAVTTTNSGNDLGFSVSNLPVGQYKIEISGLISASNNGATDGLTAARCNFKIVETTTSTDVARQISQDSSVSTSSAEETRDYVNSFSGIYNNTSVATRNFRLETQKFADDSTGNIAICQAFSNTGSNTYNSNITFLMTPLDQPSNSALYVQGPVLGAQTGAAISAGYVGQKISGAGSNVTPADITWTSFANTGALPAGIYQCVAYVTVEPNSGSFTTGRFSISTANNTVGTTQVTLYPPQSGNFQSYGIVSSLQITSTGSTTAYANVLFQTPTGAIKPSVVGSSSGIECTRLN